MFRLIVFLFVTGFLIMTFLRVTRFLELNTKKKELKERQKDPAKYAKKADVIDIESEETDA